MKSYITIAVVSALAAAAHADILWQDDDPASAATSQNAGLTVTPVASSIGNSATVGLLDHGGAAAFSSLTKAGGAFDITAYQGGSFTFSFDWYVPSTTVATGNDLFYTQVNFDGVNSGSAGFVNVLANADDTWRTFTWDAGPAIPETASTMEVFFIFVDDGFGGTPDQAAGTTMYLDNVQLDVIPEPATMGLLAVFGGGLLFIRNRFMI